MIARANTVWVQRDSRGAKTGAGRKEGRVKSEGRKVEKWDDG